MSDTLPSSTQLTQSKTFNIIFLSFLSLSLYNKYRAVELHSLQRITMIMFFFSQSKWGPHHVSQGQTKQQTPAGSKALWAGSLVFSPGHQSQFARNVLSRNENLRTELWHRVQGFHLASSEGKNNFVKQSRYKETIYVNYYKVLWALDWSWFFKYGKVFKIYQISLCCCECLLPLHAKFLLLSKFPLSVLWTDLFTC